MTKYLPTKNTKQTKKEFFSKILFYVSFVPFVGILLFACSGSDTKPASNMTAAREAKKEIKLLRADIRKIEPFFKPMGKHGMSDWLASHNEPGQTFEEYLDADPTKPTKARQTIYVLPLGEFNAKQQRLIDAAAGYLEVFYDLKVAQMPAKALNTTAANMRVNKLTKVRQIKTGFILNDILKPMVPADAAALIAFTTDDLYPDESMNYVFGQASLDDRVGVWSLSRLDDNTDEMGFLRRTLKIAAHETGHMFSIRHCTKWECLMSGTNHLAETDSRPIDACPECTAKICWLSDISSEERYNKLTAYVRSLGLAKEADEFDKKAAAVKTPTN